MIQKSGAMLTVLVMLLLTVNIYMVSHMFQKQQLTLRATTQEKNNNHKNTPSFQELPSGWDSSGIELWRSTTDKLMDAFLNSEDALETTNTFPLGPVRTHKVKGVAGNGWFSRSIDGSPGWEHDTFQAFLKYVPGHNVYVDFGTWIGPTLFYCAQLVDRAYGIEADPVAFAVVQSNLVLNNGAQWYSRVHIQPGGVGIGSHDGLSPVNVPMQSGGAGNSCSGMSENAGCGSVKVKWKVNTYPLPALLHRWGVDEAEAFIKVDVESFECKLIGSWMKWLEPLDVKPSFYLTLHRQVDPCTDEEYETIAKFGMLFKSVVVDGNHLPTASLQGSDFNNAKVGSKEVLFSDRARD